MKKSLSSIFATLLFSSSLFAVEWGGLVNGTFKYNNNADTKVSEFKKATKTATTDDSLWIRIPFSKDGDNYFITEGTYNFEYENTNSKGTHSQYLDLSLFKFFFTKDVSNDNGHSSFDVSIGRYCLSDLTGLIYSQNTDSAMVKYNSDNFVVSLFGGYTGLLNGRAVKIISVVDKNTFIEDKDKIYQCAEKFFVGDLSITLQNLFANQSITIEGLGTFRTEGNSYSRMYASIGLTGPIISNLFYEVTSTLLYSKYDENDAKTGNLSRLNLTYFTNFKNAALGVTGIFASKDFIGFTSKTAVESQEELKYQGIFKGGLFASIKPVNNLIFTLSGDSVFDYNRGDKKDSFGFAGFQIQGFCSFQMFSDLNINASLIQYLDNDVSNRNKTTIELSASFTI